MDIFYNVHRGSGVAIMIVKYDDIMHKFTDCPLINFCTTSTTHQYTDMRAMEKISLSISICLSRLYTSLSAGNKK